MGASWGSPAGGVDTEHQADGQDDELGQVWTSDVAVNHDFSIWLAYASYG